MRSKLLAALRRSALLGSASVLGSVIAAQPGHAAGALLDFEGIGDVVSIEEYYNGGMAGNGVSGPDYDVTFSGNALALVDADDGGSGNIANEPSPSSVMFWLDDVDAHMNFSPGFNQFSVYYTAPYNPGTLSFWDGVNGGGTQVGAVQQLVTNGDRCGGDPTGAYNCWTKIAVNLPSSAYSVTFGGTANWIAFDDLAFNPQDLPNQDVPGPLPVVGVAAALGFSRRLRKRLNQAVS